MGQQPDREGAGDPSARRQRGLQDQRSLQLQWLKWCDRCHLSSALIDHLPGTHYDPGQASHTTVDPTGPKGPDLGHDDDGQDIPYDGKVDRAAYDGKVAAER